ncbi:MAG: immunity protein Imm5 [Candidatus Symbiothrix sp.]|jgi:hypothetical protein|nr:immunity protein Imm5 [Candidatus Symbiothrix sp.]
MKEKIKKLKKIVRKSKSGHLPLKYRVKLLGTIGNVNTINKIFFECLKKVFPIWNTEYPNNSVMLEIISKADAYLYRQTGNKNEFESFFNEYVNYFESIEGSVGLSGMSATALCASIAYGAALTVDDYDGEDDNAFDWDMWNTDFYASMAYSGGNPFIKEGDINKRVEFWDWYLETVLTIATNPDQPLISLDLEQPVPSENVSEDKRKQSINTESILAGLKKVADLSIEDLINQNGDIRWEKIEVESCCIPSGLSIMTNFYINN